MTTNDLSEKDFALVVVIALLTLLGVTVLIVLLSGVSL